MFWPDPTHPPTHQTIHPPMGGEVSTDFKSSNRIEISQLVQVLLNFEWFRGSPLGVGGWGWGWWEGAPTHMHAHACMCISHHREFPGIPQKSNGSSHLHEIIMFTMHVCVCMHAHACACVWGAPPTPRAAGSPKHQYSISLELIEIIRFCLKILYLWTFLNSYRL